MSDWDMEVYVASAGVEMTVSCRNQEAYGKAKEYLTSIGANCGPPGQVRKRPEFFYLQDEQQLRSLLGLLKAQLRK